MAGHSKWANIQHRKKAQDNKRGKIFTKIIREITVAVRLGGPDITSNSRLRLAMTKANKNSVPKDTIERAIKKGSGQSDSSFEEITYEGIGPGGVCIIIQTLTDNKDRSAATVRSTITRAGGTFASTGSVSWNFEQKGQIVINVNDEDPEMVALESIDDGAEDFDVYENTVEITCQYSDLSNIQKKIGEKENVSLEKAEIALVPNSTVTLDKEQSNKTLRLLDDLEDLDDVQKVFTNAEFNEDALSSYAE